MSASAAVPHSIVFAFLRSARCDRSLSPLAFRVLSALVDLSHCGLKVCEPTGEDLAEMSGTSRSRAFVALAELVEHGLVSVISGKRARRASRYTILWDRYGRPEAELEIVSEESARVERPARPKDRAGKFAPGSAGLASAIPVLPMPKLSGEAWRTLGSPSTLRRWGRSTS